MASRRRSPSISSSSRAARHATGIALAAPMVVATRLAQFAAAGNSPSKRDRAEFQRMFTEKATASVESWNAMALAASRAGWRAAMTTPWWSLWSWWTAPLSGRLPGPLPASVQRSQRRTVESIAAAGLAPVHRRVASNAKRLGKSGTKRR